MADENAMTLADVRKAQQELEKKLSDLVNKFAQDTGTNVTNVSSNHNFDGEGRPAGVTIHIQVFL